MSQTSKRIDTDITSSPFQLPVDIERSPTTHPGQIDYFKEYTGIWRHGTLPGFDVTLHSQDGTGRIKVIKDVPEKFYLPDNPFGEGEDFFVGWSYTPDGELITDAFITITKNTSLFAKWRTRDKYTLSFDLMGGYDGPEEQEKTEGIPIIIPDVTPKLASNTFMGWGMTPFDTEPTYKIGDEYDIDEDFTLYAVWKHDTYKITFFSNGGSGSMPSQSGVYGIYYLPECKFKAPSGKTFAGWSYESSGSPIQSRKVFITSNTKLYAIWVTGDFIVSYDLDGGSPSIKYQVKKADIPLTLSSITPTKENHTFLGWCADDSMTPHFQPGDVYNFNASVSLVAVWKQNGYLVTYDANGGTGGPTSQVKQLGVPLVITSQVPTRKGFLFLGWGLYKTGSVVYSPGDTYTEDADLKLFAIWKELIFKVYYDNNGGSGKMEPSSVKYGIFVLPECTFTPPESSKFIGWTESLASGIIVKQISITDSDRTVYALWRRTTSFTITYDANGGTGAPAAQTKYSGIPIGLSKVVPTRDHYKFKGWGTAPEGPVVYQPGDLYAKDEDIKLFAIWEIDKFTLTFNANGGSGEMPPVILEYGEQKIPGSKFIPPEGYRFSGWSESPTDINLVSNILMDSDKTVYAIWTDKQFFLVTYDLNGAPKEEEDKFPPQYKQYLYQIQIPKTIPHYSLDPEIDKNWIFTGWQDINGKKYNAGSYYVKEMDTSLTAGWHELENYPVVFLPNGAKDGYMEPLDVFGTITLPACGFVPPDGTEFIGWALGPYDDLLPDKINIGSKVVLYAIYE